MKKFLSRLLGKLSLTAIMIAIQFAWIIFMVYQATVLSKVFNGIFNLLALLLALHVVNMDRKPYFKLSWCFLILCFPIFGCTSYFLFGRSSLTKKNSRQLDAVNKELIPYRRQDRRIVEEIGGEELLFQKEVSYVREYAGFPVCREKDSLYYSCGEEAFPDMLKDLENAKKYIFLEYFILAPGVMFDTMLEILERKVREGLEVRMIYDDIGSINTLSPRFDKIMEEKGIRCLRFNPFRPVMSVIMNNRDHRKILVVDGKVAYTGGINLADEYINKIERFGYWKDEAIRVEGRSVWSFTTMFLEMWNYILKSTEDYGRYDLFPEEDADSRSEQPPAIQEVAGAESGVRESEQPSVDRASAKPEVGGASQDTERPGYLLPFSDSPLDQEDVSENVYLNIIYSAKDYIYIFTPYLILSWEMNRALVNAVKTGVDVRIVTPGVPDKKMVYLLTQANSESLIRGGVKIYTYKPGFIHSKCIVSDDKYAVVGTINLDFRSLYLHFECGILLYKAKAVMQVYQDAIKTFKESHLVRVEEYEDNSLFRQLLLSILNLFAPLL